MEVLGAVASSIAVVQAAAAGKHIVSIIREIPGIQDDFDYLMKEVRGFPHCYIRIRILTGVYKLNLINSMVKAIPRMSPSAYEQDLINLAAKDLNEVTKELEELLRGCFREVNSKDGKICKTRKRKWLLEKSTITKLQQRMRNAKTTLHFAVASSHATNNAQFQAYMRQMFMNLYAIHAVQNDTSDIFSHKKPEIDQQTDSSGASALEAITTNNQEDKERVVESISIQSRTHIWDVSSSTSCQCSCHFAKRQYQNSGWVQSLFGSWLVRYENRPQECSNPDCQCLSPSVLKLEYQVPRWLFFRSFAIVSSYNNIGGLRCSLRPFKLLEVPSILWTYQEGSSQAVRESVLEHGVYPCDADITGVGLIEDALIYKRYTALETLLDLWGNLLPQVELPRRITNQANDLLSWGHLGEHEIYLLQKLVRLIGHQSMETTKIHIAIRRREGLQAALQEQPWAINTIDYTGHCPLTLATDRGQTNCMEMLISAGADVNQLASQGDSALIVAAKSESPGSVRLLLNAKCRVDWTSMNGSTALHKASCCHCAESVSLLLAAGVSATRRNAFGETPLHWLAFNKTNNRSDTKRIIDLLILAGNDLEARDISGGTPATTSLVYDNISVMECLLDLGCSLSWSDSNNKNILHLAAIHSSLEMLEYLDCLGLYDINPYQESLLANTPRDFILHLYDQKFVGFRAPSTAELIAFLNLCQGVKDRSLQRDIDNLQQVVAGLQNRDAATARKHLGSLLAKEERWKREDLVCWYRAVDKRIQNLEWDLATEDLSDYLTELKEGVGTPVYDIPSEYPCKFLDSRTWESEVSESESSESEISE
ncbi:unnamed protein product [Fusarium equiseti]|uniref:NACHT-NTPase and P-loop NTPases N-terminal domain-containing protein n=1 Tax=Fusarium equiseti TaxID=61235 RepID=A0A8J2NI01_FUSEQ|nr:unnamed protein product [Fusarium equiseti]